MEPVTTVLGGVVVAVISGGVGKYIGGKDKVTDQRFDEVREACQQLLIEKIDNLAGKVEDLTKIVNDKIIK